MKFFPEKLSVEITTRCNLHCEICPKQSPNYEKIECDMDFELFRRLSPLFPYINSLVLNGIGEPLMHPELEKFIAFAKENMPQDSKIGFQTNGVFLSETKLKDLIKAGLNRICVSIDCIEPVKGLHDPEIGRKALDIISHAKKSVARLECGIEIVITKENFYQIIPTIYEALKYEVDFVILSHLIPYSAEANSLVAYETNNEGAVIIFKKWFAQLINEGFTVKDWMEQMKKKALPEFFLEDNKPLKIFKDMYEEATDKGITLHMNNLINRNDFLINEVREMLEEVTLISRKMNLPIQIPRTTPFPKRKCDFLEEKCMFIGVDGEVSPCYFLWHNFTCYIAGLKKSVKRWSFGNIKDRNPLDIFNSSDYRGFINSVLRYDFPYCYDCNFALCDLMELEDFLYDCYTNTVPCGACLWCGGLFYCMI